MGRRSTRTGKDGSKTTYTGAGSGQLYRVASPGGSVPTTSTYYYGASGMREYKSVLTAGVTRTTTSVWNGSQLAIEKDSDGKIYRYLFGPGGVPLELSVKSGSTYTSYAYHTDAQGNAVALTTTAGVAVATHSYDPWGNPTSVGGSDPVLAARQPLRYRGYYYDTETGLYYLPARFYDPATMGFLSPDPAAPEAGNPATLNAYAYCEGDPVNASDPSGEKSIADAFKAVCAAVGPMLRRAARWLGRLLPRSARDAVKNFGRSVTEVVNRSRTRTGGVTDSARLVRVSWGADGGGHAPPEDTSRFGRGNSVQQWSRPGDVDWGMAVFGTSMDVVGDVCAFGGARGNPWGYAGAVVCWVTGGVVDVCVYYGHYIPEHEKGNITLMDRETAKLSWIPNASFLMLLVYVGDELDRMDGGEGYLLDP